MSPPAWLSQSNAIRRVRSLGCVFCLGTGLPGHVPALALLLRCGQFLAQRLVPPLPPIAARCDKPCPPASPAASFNQAEACPGPCDKQKDGSVPCSTPGTCQVTPGTCDASSGQAVCTFAPATAGTPCTNNSASGFCNLDGECVVAGATGSAGERADKQASVPADACWPMMA